jgi:ATP-dependent Clp protease ATP-binding subunit ClpC
LVFPFERLTDPVRRVIVLAQEEAIRLRHTAVDTGHVLLALVQQDTSVAAKTIESFGISREDLRVEIEHTVGRGEGVATEEVIFSTRARAAVIHAREEAFSLGHNYVGSEHLLLSLLRDESSVAAEMLCKLIPPIPPHQTTLDTVRARVRFLLGEGGPSGGGVQ